MGFKYINNTLHAITFPFSSVMKPALFVPMILACVLEGK